MFDKEIITSYHLKAHLYAYWRYKKQYIVADEVSINGSIADIIVNTGKFLIEIETKISKSDLIQGEKRKKKHEMYIKGMNKYKPNQFYICVPDYLIKDAEIWVDKTNKDYGILAFRPGYYGTYGSNICTIKRPKFLHEEPIQDWQKRKIIMRLSSACATHAIGKIPYTKYEEDYCI